MTKEQKRIKSEEFLKNQEKIIEIWKSGDKVLALQLCRSIMTDKKVLEFCTNSYEINKQSINQPINWYKFKIEIDNHYFRLGYDGWIEHNTTFYNNYFPPKNEKSILILFRKFLNKVCTNKRPHKPKQI